jgi:hypothetical protein
VNVLSSNGAASEGQESEKQAPQSRLPVSCQLGSIGFHGGSTHFPEYWIRPGPREERLKGQIPRSGHERVVIVRQAHLRVWRQRSLYEYSTISSAATT